MASNPKIKPERKAKPSAPTQTFSLISDEKLLAIYAAMVRCRMVQQRATMLFQQGKLSSDLHASSGREAVAAAVTIDLQPSDSLCLYESDWLPAIVKGVALENLFHALAPALVQSNGFTPPSTAEIDHRVFFSGDQERRPALVRDLALAAQTAKHGALVAAILPSGENLLKPWREVLANAASQKLPIVFVHYADSSNLKGTSQAGYKGKNPHAFFHGVPAITVDASDAVAVYRVAFEAIARARQGRGASLLECLTLPGAIVPGDASEVEDSVSALSTADSPSIMEGYLKSKGIHSAQHNRSIVASCTAELDLATRFLNH
jgi:acetoin:2,6-dichlorophenolindophenol oxidoreductase subunit alpha